MVIFLLESGKLIMTLIIPKKKRKRKKKNRAPFDTLENVDKMRRRYIIIIIIIGRVRAVGMSPGLDKLDEISTTFIVRPREHGIVTIVQLVPCKYKLNMIVFKAEGRGEGDG